MRIGVGVSGGTEVGGTEVGGTEVGGTGVSGGTEVGWTGVGVSSGTGVSGGTEVGRTVVVGEMGVEGVPVMVQTGVVVGMFSPGWELEVGVIDGFGSSFVERKEPAGARVGVGVGLAGGGGLGVAVKVGAAITIRCAVGIIRTHGAVTTGEGVWRRNGITRYKPTLVRPCAIVTPKMERVRSTTQPKYIATPKTKIRSRIER